MPSMRTGECGNSQAAYETRPARAETATGRRSHAQPHATAVTHGEMPYPAAVVAAHRFLIFSIGTIPGQPAVDRTSPRCRHPLSGAKAIAVS
jgi:hypothetical protein